MTPRRARQALCVFVLLALAVAYNALFRQLRPVVGGGGIAAELPAAAAPAPTLPNKAANAGAERTAAPKDAPDKRAQRAGRAAKPEAANGEATGSALGSQKSETARPETVRAIGRELRQRGYGSAAGEGAPRAQRSAAIMAYEYDNGLPLTGQASEALLERILFGGPGAGEGQGKVASAEAAELVRFVQQALSALGYQPGPVNGQLQADTVRAIREFELDKGLVPRGRISPELM
ncbi:MAG TPA: peptidoglycan-binding domain-containing protein, partial [Hyphomicrobiaceae bacterium]|nr:peptidoglycan-binding domain-containing protein [Hyphomicrobiaceae bacterium]